MARALCCLTLGALRAQHYRSKHNTVTYQALLPTTFITTIDDRHFVARGTPLATWTHMDFSVILSFLATLEEMHSSGDRQRISVFKRSMGHGVIVGFFISFLSFSG